MKVYCITEISPYKDNSYGDIFSERLFLNKEKRDKEFYKLPPDNECNFYYKIDRETED